MEGVYVIAVNFKLIPEVPIGGSLYYNYRFRSTDGSIFHNLTILLKVKVVMKG